MWPLFLLRCHSSTVCLLEQGLDIPHHATMTLSALFSNMPIFRHCVREPVKDYILENIAPLCSALMYKCERVKISPKNLS